MDVRDWLFAQNLGHLWHSFEENKIDDMEMVKLLKDDEIETLCKKVLGDKIRLRRQIDALNKEYDDEAPPTKIIKRSDTDMLLNSQPPIVTNMACPLSPISTIEPAIITVAVDPSHGTASASTDTVDSDVGLGSNISFQNYDIHTEIQQLFANDLVGLALINKSKNKNMSNADRDKISEIVVTHFMNKYKRLDHDHFRVLSENIEKLFMNEKKNTYFISPIKKCKSKDRRSERARGKLVEKYRNKLHLIKVLTEPEDSSENKQNNIIGISQEVKDSEIWLKHNTESATVDILNHWQESYPARKIKREITIENYLEDWPVLKTQLAPDLISYDFEQIHPGNNLDVQAKLKEVFEKLYTTKKNVLNCNDSSIATLLDCDITTDSLNAVRLYLLPSLIPTKGRTKIIGKKPWKPSVQETRDAIFLHVKTPADIEEIQQSRMDAMFEKGLTVQPHIIFIGPSLGNVVSSLVIINNIQYKCKSVTDALDFCFKAYQVLDAKYPFEAQHIWYLVQWLIYGYKTEFDPKLPLLNEFL